MQREKILVKTLISVLLIAVVWIGGCNDVRYSAEEEARYVKPTIAVMSFENRAPVHTKWQLGSAMADQLTDRLMTTRRYVVLERAQLQAILQELRRTESPEFRKIGQPERGQLKHVQYLIKGTITDFGHVEHVEGIFQWILSIFGSTSQSIVAATIYVIDVQSGQVIASSNVEAKIRDKKEKDKTEVDGMSFGSYTFYHTNLGKATNEMLDKAVRVIAKTIAEQPFQPKISSILNDRIIITGGKDRKIQVGDEYIVRPASDPVIDPDTGDLLGHITGAPVGRLRVLQVTQKYSIAQPVRPEAAEGEPAPAETYMSYQFEPGQTLFKADIQTTQAATAVTSY
ncbi:MAG: hypothetical protein JW860_12610 [Sedimentisphaerales bacterium]|nr:hypothetical protein [Sedimentisphaerales bacterium]